MAFTITSYTPTTGPTTGGTLCTVTGTGLTVVDEVLVGGNLATIVGTPGATSMQFRTPAHAAGDATVTLVDTDASETHNAGTQFTYAAVTSESTFNTLAGKMALDVRVVGDTDWTRVRSVLTIKPEQTYSTEDDSDTDSGIDGTDFVNSRKGNITGTVKRTKGVLSGAYNAGQEIIRNAADNAGTPDGTIEARWYDRTGGPEAYEATAIAQWSPQGGNKTTDKVDFTLNIQGAKTTITNPVIADSSLADGYA